ncbi:MAG TPA: hypothetical protein VJZ00_00050 [Thermoanaerobaculia bacterium]|nr:hypothetical protein [Thermoanaerobaculia bacterium]
MTIRGPVACALLCAMLAAPMALAQTPTQDERITALEQKLDQLLKQAEEIRQELQQLKPAAAPADDLTNVDVMQTPSTPPPAPTEAAAEPSSPALTDIKPVENQVSAGASKALNPDISAIGNFLGHAGDVNTLDERAPAELDEAELALEAFIDPYAKGKFFISITPEEVDVEEGYAQFIALPFGLTAKAGKTKATFGKANTWHTHTRPWVDQPLMVSRFLGDEGLADVGLSVSKDIANPFHTFVEATGEVYSGNVDGAFGRVNQNDLFYNAHLKVFRDLTENSNLEVGTSLARGTLPPDEDGLDLGHNRLAGVDVTYRWKPLSRSIYNSFIGRFEGLANRRGDFDRNLYGYYASADYQFAQRWFAGVRFDSADRVVDLDRANDRGISGTLTFWPSEFSQIRGQFRRTRLGTGPTFNELLLQLQFAIGAHGAHTF